MIPVPAAVVAELVIVAAFLFCLGVMVGAQPGATRIKDMAASQRIRNRSVAGMGLCVAAYWIVFVFVAS